jgi:K+-sensing histidine kinase KdpD
VRLIVPDAEFVLDVWNTGEPIAPDSIDKICEPFWRPSTTGNREGLGLGLYICSQIVRAHGGTLSVISNEKSGTHFTARLPLDSDHLDQNAGNGRTQQGTDDGHEGITEIGGALAGDGEDRVHDART